VLIYESILKGNALLYILESLIKRWVRSSIAATVAYTVSATLGWMDWTHSTRIYGLKFITNSSIVGSVLGGRTKKCGKYL